jgi:hypothetical protein
VFWPFFYGDVFTYALWPYADYDPFWAYGPDYLLTSIFWPGPDYGPDYGGGAGYNIYADNGDGGNGRAYVGAGHAKERHRDRHEVGGGQATPTRVAKTNETGATSTPEPPATTELAQTCTGLAPGVTDLPVDRIERAVQPSADQARALEDFKAASRQASDVVKASCPSEVPLTPIGRLDAVQKRFQAMIQAIQLVRSPLEAFHNSLSEEQRQRFDALGTETGSANPAARASTSNDVVSLCDQRAGSFTQLPVQRVEQTMELNKQQQDAFDELKQASIKAAAELQNSCPRGDLQNPIERLTAVEKRLTAMVAAMEDLRPALNRFYASLSDEQKARFNTIGRTQSAQEPQRTGGR